MKQRHRQKHSLTIQSLITKITAAMLRNIKAPQVLETSITRRVKVVFVLVSVK